MNSNFAKLSQKSKLKLQLLAGMVIISGGIGTNVPGLFKAKAGNLLLNWG